MSKIPDFPAPENCVIFISMQSHRLSELSKILTWGWLALALPGPLVGAFIGLDLFWVINLVTNLVLLGGGWWLQNEFYAKGRHELFVAWRKFVGYGIVVGYCLVNIASLSWGSDLMWYLSAAQGLVGWFLWLCLRIRSTERHYGYTPPAKGAKKPFADAVLENIDILIQTVFLVIVLQQLFFQLYVIPSESMVPTLLKEDRPFVVKSFDGPEIPMSHFRLPTVAGVSRGQIIVFESPVYDEPPVIAQMLNKAVFFLTLSNVNLDVDADGKPKVQFVVKRVVGVPGEKLMMVDDQLYHKTAADQQWTLIQEDAKFRHVDLWKEPAEVQARIGRIEVHQNERALLDRLDAEKNSTDPEKLRVQLAADVEHLKKALAAPGAKPAALLIADLESALPAQPVGKNAESLLAALSAPAPLAPNVTLYERSARVVNLMHKQVMVELYLARLEKRTDAELKALGKRANELEVYLVNFFDMRNFPEYPFGEGNYIPDGKYFLMGDNRYASLDFRFDAKENRRQRALDATDPNSTVYSSALGLRLLDRDLIIGHLAFRLWPLNKMLVE